MIIIIIINVNVAIGAINVLVRALFMPRVSVSVAFCRPDPVGQRLKLPAFP